MVQLGNQVFIRQEIEIAEIFTPFETGNRYCVLDSNGQDILHAYEDESNFILKQIFGSHRGLKIHILDEGGQEIFFIERDFFWFKTNATIYLPNGEFFGYIKQRKWFGNKQFDFLSLNGDLLFSCISKLPHIWTFDVIMQNNPVAQILKKWSGAGREMFTDADKFNVNFGNIEDESIKYSILACAFVIDLRVFEKKS